jgi:hypothetical protein
MIAASFASVCVAGVMFMLWFLVQLCRELACQNQKLTAWVTRLVHPRHARLNHAPLVSLGATYEYQDAVLRWPINLDTRGAGAGRNRRRGRIASPATLKKLQHAG